MIGAEAIREMLRAMDLEKIAADLRVEIAESLGVRKASIKILLFRARRRLAAALGGVRAFTRSRV